MQAAIRFLAFLGMLVLLSAPAVAAGKAAEKAPVPDRESLVRFWEETTRKDPHVSRFEKTKDAGVYNFSTDFFPYKGRLKLLNAVVAKSDETYTNFYTGIVEVELLDASADFYKKYSMSYGAWTRQNYFYYNPKKAIWFPSSEWNANSSDYYGDSGGSSTCAQTSSWSRYKDSIIYLSVLVALIGGLLAFAKKQNKRIWDNHARALAEQQRGLKMVEESLKHQHEHTQLLREIAASLKK